METNRAYRDRLARALCSMSEESFISFSSSALIPSPDLSIELEGIEFTFENFRQTLSPSKSELLPMTNPSEIINLGEECSLPGIGWSSIMSSAIREFQVAHEVDGEARLEARLSSILTFKPSDAESLLGSPPCSMCPFTIDGDRLITARFGRIILLVSPCDPGPNKEVADSLTLYLLPANSDRSVSEISNQKPAKGGGLSSKHMLPPPGQLLCLSFSSDLSASILVSTPNVFVIVFDVYDPQLPSFVEQIFQVPGRLFYPLNQPGQASEREAKGVDPVSVSCLGTVAQSMMEWESAATAFNVLVEQTDQVHAFLLSSPQVAHESTNDKGGPGVKEPLWVRVLRHHDLAGSYLPTVHNKLVHPLSHKYSPAVLEAGWRALRGSDRTLAKLLLNLEVSHQLDVYVASLSLSKTPLPPALHSCKDEHEPQHCYDCILTGLRHVSHGEPPRAPLQHITTIHVAQADISDNKAMNDLTRQFSEVFVGPPDITPSPPQHAPGRLLWTKSALVLVPRCMRFDLLAQSTTLQATTGTEVSGTVSLLHLIQSTTNSLLVSGGTQCQAGTSKLMELKQMVLSALRSLTLHHPSMGQSWNNGRIGNWVDVLSQACSVLNSTDLARALLRGAVCLMVEEVSQRSQSASQPDSLPIAHAEAMSALLSLTSRLADGWVLLKAEVELWSALVCGLLNPRSPYQELQPGTSRVLLLPFGVGGVIEAAAMISGLHLASRGILVEGRGKILSRPMLLAQHLNTLSSEQVATAVNSVEGAAAIYMNYAHQFDHLCKKVDESLSVQAQSQVYMRAEAQKLKDNAASFKPRPSHLLLLLQTLTTMYHYNLLFSTINAMMLSEHVLKVEEELVPLLSSFDRWLGPPPSALNPDPAFSNPVLNPTTVHLSQVQNLLSKTASHIGLFLLSKLRRRTADEILRIQGEAERHTQLQQTQQQVQQAQQEACQRAYLMQQQAHQVQQEAQNRVFIMQQQQAQQDAQLLAYQVQQERQQVQREHNVAKFRMQIEQSHERVYQSFIWEEVEEEQPPSPPPPPLPPPPSPTPLPSSEPSAPLAQQPPKYIGVSSQSPGLFVSKTRVRGHDIVLYKGPSALEAARAYDSAVCYARGPNKARNFNDVVPEEPEASVRAKLDVAVHGPVRVVGGGQQSSEMLPASSGGGIIDHKGTTKRARGEMALEGQGEVTRQQQQQQQQFLTNMKQDSFQKAVADAACESTMKSMGPTIKSILTFLTMSSTKKEDREEILGQARALIRVDLLSSELRPLALALL